LAESVLELENREEPDGSMKDDVWSCLAGLLRDLKPGYRHAIETVDLRERGLAELAVTENAGITPGNAAVRVHRARENLRKRVLDAGGMFAKAGCRECSCRSARNLVKSKWSSQSWMWLM
jgi:DNA-directed RNA polymerase specialized sigma24 family protein